MALTRGQEARAWVNFNGTGTVAIRDSFNVSSITDNGTGNYTINFDQAMPNANYCAVCSIGAFDGRTPTVLSYLTSSVNVRTHDGATIEDQSYVNVTIFGDAS